MNSSIPSELILVPPVAIPEGILGLAVPPFVEAAVEDEFNELVLEKGSGRVYRRATDIDPQIWRTAFGDFHKDFEYYRLIEETMNNQFDYRYLLLFDKDENPVALQPLILVDQDLAALASSAIRRAVGSIRRLRPRFLRSRMLLAGCLVGDAGPGVIAPANTERISAMLAESLLIYARRQKIPLISIKDFPATMRECLSPLADTNYTRLGGFPPLVLSLNFTSFEQYMKTRLSRTMRKGLRRKLRKSGSTSPLITLEVWRDCTSIIDEIYPLYLNVARRAPVEFEILSREYFIEAGRRMPGRHRYFVWRRGHNAIAFSFCTIWRDAIYDNDLGLDYDVAHDLSLYHRTFRDIIVWALEQGLKEYHCAPFNYEPKSHLRLQLVDVDLYVRHTSPLINAVLKYLAPHFAPAKSDPALRNYSQRAKS